MAGRNADQIKPIGEPLFIDGISWHVGGEGERHQYCSGLKLEPGTVTLLMGPNGAGKTTLLEKLAGLRPPEGLNIVYGTEPLWIERKIGKPRLNVKALRSYSYACQSPEEGLFARTVADELEYSLRPYRQTAANKEQSIQTALRSVGWNQSWLTRDPYLMSGGERRRAALSAVFATPASWLLLDEPTAGLDGSGHEKVAQRISELKAQNSGIVLVSHDSDWALPLADQVMMLSPEGSLKICSREALLAHPEWLEETGMSVPQWLRTAHLLWRNGIPSEKIWNPAEAAHALAKSSSLTLTNQTSTASRKMISLKNRQPAAARPLLSPLLRFDPRSVWLAYMLLSAGMFAQSSWIGIAAGAIVTITLLAVGRISLLRWRGVIRNFVVFSLLVAGLLAVGEDEGGGLFDATTFLGALIPFARTLLVMLLGLGIAIVMTPLSLRRSLDQLLSVNGKTPAIAQKVILTVTLIIRFVPVLLRQWERFVRIFLARGKEISRSPLAAVRRLRDVTLPFLLSLFRLADEVVLALESRGVGEHATPTRGERLRWEWRDSILVLGSLLLAGGLWWFSKK